MKARPSQTACGCLPLLVGVELICLLTIIECVSSIAACSSAESVRFLGVEIPPLVQVLEASWCFLGIPLAINAGVGALYRIQSSLKLFFLYLLASFFLGALFPIYTLLTGKLCNEIVVEEAGKMGSTFACGFTDTFFFVWTFIIGMIDLYLIYIIWSASEELASTGTPELVKYSDALRSVRAPAPVPGPYPLGPSRATPIESFYGPAQGMLPRPAAGPKNPFSTTGYQQQGAIPFGTNLPPAPVPMPTVPNAGNPFNTAGYRSYGGAGVPTTYGQAEKMMQKSPTH